MRNREKQGENCRGRDKREGREQQKITKKKAHITVKKDKGDQIKYKDKRKKIVLSIPCFPNYKPIL